MLWTVCEIYMLWAGCAIYALSCMCDICCELGVRYLLWAVCAIYAVSWVCDICCELCVRYMLWAVCAIYAVSCVCDICCELYARYMLWAVCTLHTTLFIWAVCAIYALSCVYSAHNALHMSSVRDICSECFVSDILWGKKHRQATDEYIETNNHKTTNFKIYMESSHYQNVLLYTVYVSFVILLFENCCNKVKLFIDRLDTNHWSKALQLLRQTAQA